MLPSAFARANRPFVNSGLSMLVGMVVTCAAGAALAAVVHLATEAVWKHCAVLPSRRCRGCEMGRFIEGCDRHQKLLLSDCVDDYVSAENPARVIDVFVDELDLAALGFEGAAATGRPGYRPATLGSVSF